MYESRFFKIDDPQIENFIYNLPKSWWSRRYEYEWVKNFAKPNDIALDAASGIVHPLRFWLARHCKDVYSCDIDSNIIKDLTSISLSQFQIDEHELQKIFPIPHNLHSNLASLTKLPYKNCFFDKIYCISVLEHLQDNFNKFFLSPLYFSITSFFLKKDIFLSLKEFFRVLKPGGYILLTFDYPDISLKYLDFCVQKIGFKFVSSFNTKIDNSTLSVNTRRRNYKIFRAVLVK